MKLAGLKTNVLKHHQQEYIFFDNINKSTLKVHV